MTTARSDVKPGYFPGLFRFVDMDGREYTVQFNYRSRKITNIMRGGRQVRVAEAVFNRAFGAMKRLVEHERKNKTGPFWGPEGPCHDNPVRRVPGESYYRS